MGAAEFGWPFLDGDFGDCALAVRTLADLRGSAEREARGGHPA